MACPGFWLARCPWGTRVAYVRGPIAVVLALGAPIPVPTALCRPLERLTGCTRYDAAAHRALAAAALAAERWGRWRPATRRRAGPTQPS